MESTSKDPSPHTQVETDADESVKSTGNAGDAPPADTVEGEVHERGGRKGLDPTRFGDWEKNGRCIDF